MLAEKQSVIAFADHITTIVDIDDVKAVSQALINIGLPQAWPLSEQPGFSTVGIRLGNINLELCAVDRRVNKLDDWLTFEPTDLDNLAEELAKRGVMHDPFDAVVAGAQPIYTRIGLSDLEQGTTALQLCHLFYPTRTTGPIAPNNAAGIKTVQTVNIAMNSDDQEILFRLLALNEWTGNIQFNEGPSLSVTPADHLLVGGLTIIVNNIEQAATKLMTAGFKRIDKQTLELGSLRFTLTDAPQ